MDKNTILESEAMLLAAFNAKLTHTARQGAGGLFIAVSYLLLMKELRALLYPVVQEELSRWSVGKDPIEARKEQLLSEVKTIGLDKYPVARFRLLGPKNLQGVFSHPFRNAKPAGAGIEPVNTVFKPWEPADGNWADLPEYETLAIEEVGEDQVHCRYLFNPYPFGRYHFMVTFVEPVPQPQFLDPQTHDLLFRMAVSSSIPGLYLLWNPYGGHASKNQRHAHGIVLRPGEYWPVEDPRVLHDDLPYPANVKVTNDRGFAYDLISKHLNENIPVSVAYSSSGNCFVFPRRFQGQYELLAYQVQSAKGGKEARRYSSGVAIVELLGVLVTDAVSYKRVTQEVFWEQLRRATHAFLSRK